MRRSDRPRMAGAQRVGGLLRDLFGQPGFGEQLKRHEAVLIWDQVVGHQIAARTKPLRLRKGVLEVEVDHPVWMQQLHMLKPQIIAKIKAKLPDSPVEDIYLRQAKHGSIAPKTAKAVEEPPPWEHIELSAEELHEIEQQFASITDEELKTEMCNLRILQQKVSKSMQSD